jgi:hypothetical protein
VTAAASAEYGGENSWRNGENGGSQAKSQLSGVAKAMAASIDIWR